MITLAAGVILTQLTVAVAMSKNNYGGEGAGWNCQKSDNMWTTPHGKSTCTL